MSRGGTGLLSSHSGSTGQPPLTHTLTHTHTYEYRRVYSAAVPGIAELKSRLRFHVPSKQVVKRVKKITRGGTSSVSGLLEPYSSTPSLTTSSSTGQRLLFLEGHRLVLDALHSGLVPSQVFLSDKAVEAPLGRSLLCALLQEQEQEQHQELHQGQGRAVADGSNDSEGEGERECVRECVRECECERECGVAPVLYWTSSDVMSRLTTTSTTQGVCAIVPHSDDRFCIRERELSSLVVCDGVADPGNLGTIIRTSHAMNVEGVVVVGGCTPWVSTHSLTHSLTQ